MKDNIELFDEFINGNLSNKEVLEFNNRLTTDAKFSEEYNQYQLIVAGIAQHGASGIKEKLKEREAFHQKSRSRFKVYYKLAAAILLVLVSSFLIIKYAYTPDLNAVYQKHYEPYTNIVDPLNRSENNEALSPYQLYELERYDEAIEQLVNLSEDKMKPADLFYLGQAYLATNKGDKAIEYFNRVEEVSIYYQPSQWYIAIAFLKLGNIEQSKKQLESIIDNKGEYQRKAEVLKNQL